MRFIWSCDIIWSPGRIEVVAGSKWNQEAYLKAVRFAAKAHKGQIVPGTEFPYLAHVTMVAMEVAAALAVEEGLDGDLAVQCALLHDVIEDTGTTFQQVGQEFGAQVAQGVLALSKDPTLHESEQLTDSLKRIMLEPNEIWMVKLADRITNLQPPPSHWRKEKVVTYRREANEILAKLGAASRILAGRLADKIERYQDFVGL
jgi:(p)ppGpp synthase/HD superfamily hydrolase